MSRAAQIIIIIIGIILLGNMIFLDFYILGNNIVRVAEKEKISLASPSQIATQPDKGSTCPAKCLLAISNATASANITPSPIVNNESSLRTASSVKEYFIPLGSGTSSSDDWADVSGAQSYIDSLQYGAIKKVTFEASVHIPTGNQTAYIRLYNETDKHPVWYSDLSLSGGTPQLLISNSITLDIGNKLYQVQIKTQLKYPAVLDQARIHITTY